MLHSLCSKLKEPRLILGYWSVLNHPGLYNTQLLFTTTNCYKVLDTLLSHPALHQTALAVGAWVQARGPATAV